MNYSIRLFETLAIWITNETNGKNPEIVNIQYDKI